MQNANEALWRFQRALQMLTLAISHILHGTPDSARANLRASWDELQHNTAGRLYHMATSAFVAAVDGRFRTAAHVIRLTLSELDRAGDSLSQDARFWVWERCVLSMDYLPHARMMERCIDDAYERSRRGNYAQALYCLTLANEHSKYAPDLTPPRLRSRLEHTWTNVLEALLTDENTSAIEVVRDFSERWQPAAA